MKIMHVVGARPNFMKASPVMHSLETQGGVEQLLVHTGQHYDSNMSEIFFKDLHLPEPDINLGVGRGSHAQQTAEVMRGLEPLIQEHLPDWVLVYGDVNSTLAAALVSSKLQVPVAHVEAGLRSYDRTMPEELNRILTDQIADLLFTPSLDADQNLKKEGIDERRIQCVGNVMIDTLVASMDRIRRPAPKNLPPQYLLVTLHRPSNVDQGENLARILTALEEISRFLPVIFPVHPRTKERITLLSLPFPSTDRFFLIDPLSYLEFLYLERHAALVVTDSGGVQEETTYLGIPCLTLRKNTERPITEILGTNKVIGEDPSRLPGEVRRILSGSRKSGKIPPLWDGKASERIVLRLEEEFHKKTFKLSNKNEVSR